MINTVRLRIGLGALGMLLPWIVLFLSVVNGYGMPDSISATYYIAPCITPFMIILGASAILLMSYSGYDRQDDVICTLAGIFALCICLFPCQTSNLMAKEWFDLEATTPVGTFGLPANISGIIHNISAIAFFGLLAYNSLFLFTKTSGNMTEKKKKRNIIFRVCGVGMIASFLLLIPLGNVWGGIWLVETIALAFFGISWLTKANKIPLLFSEK